MSKRVTFSPEALDDISEILDYLDENASPTVALQFFEAVQNSVSSIAETPGICALRNFSRPALQGMGHVVLAVDSSLDFMRSFRE